MNSQSREKNSIRNFIAGSLNQILILILSLISKSIFIKTLGPVFMGLNGLFTNIFLLLSFAEFGIGSVMVYSLYSPINKKNYIEITTIYNFFRKIYISLSLIIMIIGLAIIPLIPLIVNVEQAIDNIFIYYILYLIGIIISNIYMYKSHLILADQKSYILSLYGLILETIALCLQIIIMLKTKNYALYLIVYIIKNLLYGIATSYNVRKSYSFIKEIGKSGKLNKRDRVEIYRRIRDVFGYKFARAFINGTDNILISILVGTVWVGYYSSYDLVIVGVLGLVSAFYSSISASIGNLIAKENIDDQYNIFEVIQILNMWIVGFTTTSLFILFQDFITLWLGIEYLIDFKIVILIIINYFLVCNRKSITIFREASGMFNKIKNMVILGAILNLLISVFLGYYIGIYGILLGTIISALFTYYWYEAKILMEDKFFKSIKPFVKNQTESIVYTCISIVLTSIIVYPIKNISVKSFILKMVLCLIVPNIFFIFVLNKKDRFQILVEMGIRNYKKIRSRWKFG